MGSLLATLHCWTRSHVPDSCSIPGWHLPHQPVPEEKTFYKTSVRLCPCVFLLHGPSHKDKKDPSGTAALKGQKTAENPPPPHPWPLSSAKRAVQLHPMLSFRCATKTAAGTEPMAKWHLGCREETPVRAEGPQMVTQAQAQFGAHLG